MTMKSQVVSTVLQKLKWKFLELTHHSEITKGEERIPKELPYFLQKPPKPMREGNGKIRKCKCFLWRKKVLKKHQLAT